MAEVKSTLRSAAAELSFPPAQELSLTRRCSASTNRRRQSGVLVLALLATAAVSGCHREHSADVVASVNGHAISRAELDKYYTAQQRSKGDTQTETGEQASSDRLGILREMIDQEIVEQRAAKMNLTATNEEVDGKLTEMKARFTEEQFNQLLQQNGQTLDDLRRDIRRSLTLNKLLNKEINSKINVTDAEVSNYFNAHKAEFNLIEDKYQIAQIVVTSLPAQGQSNLQGSKAANDAEAKKKIQTLRARLDSGEDFGALAMNFSEDAQTAANGGDMGFLSESQLRASPQIFEAISKLKAGQNSDILPILGPSKQPVGYTILRLIAHEAAGQRDLNNPAVQQSIRDQLRNTRSQLLKSAYLEMLRDQARVENYYAEQLFKNGSK